MRKILVLLFMFSCLLHGKGYVDDCVFTVIGGNYSGFIGKEVSMYDVLNYYEGEYSKDTSLFIEKANGKGTATIELIPGVGPNTMKLLAFNECLFFVLDDRFYEGRLNTDDFPQSVIVIRHSKLYYSIVLSFNDRTEVVLDLKYERTRKLGDF